MWNVLSSFFDSPTLYSWTNVPEHIGVVASHFGFFDFVITTSQT